MYSESPKCCLLCTNGLHVLYTSLWWITVIFEMNSLHHGLNLSQFVVTSACLIKFNISSELQYHGGKDSHLLFLSIY